MIIMDDRMINLSNEEFEAIFEFGIPYLCREEREINGKMYEVSYYVNSYDDTVKLYVNIAEVSNLLLCETYSFDFSDNKIKPEEAASAKVQYLKNRKQSKIKQIFIK